MQAKTIGITVAPGQTATFLMTLPPWLFKPRCLINTGDDSDDLVIVGCYVGGALQPLPSVMPRLRTMDIEFDTVTPGVVLKVQIQNKGTVGHHVDFEMSGPALR